MPRVSPKKPDRIRGVRAVLLHMRGANHDAATTKEETSMDSIATMDPEIDTEPDPGDDSVSSDESD